jgi:predicted nucleotide-binding protein
MNRPTIFVGSSRESLPVVDIIAEALRPDCNVLIWTDPSVFRSTEYNLDALLSLPSRCDFGIFLMEPDDLVITRGGSMNAPRDNVIFEMGLFMSQLGLKRVIPIGPRGAVRILSDIQGWQPLLYDEPSELRDLRMKAADVKEPLLQQQLNADIKKKLRPVLKKVVREIRELLKQGAIATSGVSVAAPNVVRVGEDVEYLVQSSIRDSGWASVKHLALDMSVAWCILRDEILHPGKKLNSVEWKCLLIDAYSQEIQEVASTSVRIEIAARREDQILEYLRDNADRLSEQRLTVDCRAYCVPPMIHGFLIARKALLWSMCDIPMGKLNAEGAPYFRFEMTDDRATSSHPAHCFSNWFDYLWEHKSRGIGTASNTR